MEISSNSIIIHQILPSLTEIDLNPVLYYRRSSRQGAIDEYPADRIFSNDRIPSLPRISKMRSTISGRLQDKDFFLLRSVPLLGLRADDSPRKSSRHRVLPPGYEKSSLSHGLPRLDIPQHLGLRQ